MIIQYVEQAVLDLGRLERFRLGWDWELIEEACMHDTSHEKDGKLDFRRGDVCHEVQTSVGNWFDGLSLVSFYHECKSLHWGVRLFY